MSFVCLFNTIFPNTYSNDSPIILYNRFNNFTTEIAPSFDEKCSHEWMISSFWKSSCTSLYIHWFNLDIVKTRLWVGTLSSWKMIFLFAKLNCFLKSLFVQLIQKVTIIFEVHCSTFFKIGYQCYPFHIPKNWKHKQPFAVYCNRFYFNWRLLW